MGKYNRSKNKDDSDYESDGGTHYTFEKELGKGSSAEVRQFKSKNNKRKVVLKPNRQLKNIIHEREVKNKFTFFSKLYVEQSELFSFNTDFVHNEYRYLKDYRMIVPLVSGINYDKVDITDLKAQWSLLKSGVKAIQDSHKNKKLIVIDIKQDNILYDKNTGISYLIDGGTSAEIGAPVYPEIFKRANVNEVNEKRQSFSYLPPECWSTEEVKATPKMDVYSFFYMFCLLIGSKEPHPIIQILVNLCLEESNKRPSFDEIDMLLNNENLQPAISNLIEKCQTISSNLAEKDKNTVDRYVLSTIRLALEGKDKFQKDYDGIKKSIEKIDNKVGEEYGKLILESLACCVDEKELDNNQFNDEIKQLNFN